MYIDPSKVDEIQLTVPIEDVIRTTGYQIKGTGRSKGVEGCPKCGRDHTHIKLNNHKNLFNCFSPNCDFKGNQFQWIMGIEGCSFPEAVRRVAEIGGIALVVNENHDKEKYLFEKRKQEALKLAVMFYKVNYNHSYLASRGIKHEVAVKYSCGYAPGGVVLKKFLNSKGYEDDFLLDIGLVRMVQGNKVMDRFFQAVVIPDVREGRIHDIYGRSINPNITSKHIYLYGHNSIIGWDQISHNEEVFVCESPIDVLSINQLTGKAAISTGGAGKFSNWHIYQIKKKNLIPVFANDNDESGRIATCEAVELCNEHKINCLALSLLNYKDHNDALQNGGYSLPVQSLIKPGQHFVYEYQLSKMPKSFILEYINKGL